MNISTDNLNKPTPRIPRVIGNTIVLTALSIQPLIVAASSDVMTDKSKFWASIIITIVGCFGKGFTMLFADEDLNIRDDGQN